MAALNITLYTQSDIDTLVARWRAINAQLAALSAVGDVSDQGRSISVSGTRNALVAERDALLKQIQLAAGPVCLPSRFRI